MSSTTIYFQLEKALTICQLYYSILNIDELRNVTIEEYL
jgi:hypothetical protein